MSTNWYCIFILDDLILPLLNCIRNSYLNNIIPFCLNHLQWSVGSWISTFQTVSYLNSAIYFSLNYLRPAVELEVSNLFRPETWQLDDCPVAPIPHHLTSDYGCSGSSIVSMMAYRHGGAFRITGPFVWKKHRWIPLNKMAGNAHLWF